MTPRPDVAFRLVPLGILLATAAVAGGSGPEWSARYASAPWLVALVLVGLPHGAADLAVLARLRGPRAAVRLFAAATLLSGAALGLLVIAPRLALAAFVLVTIWHFGTAHARGRSPPPPAGSLVLQAVARGGGVLGLPLAVWPAETAAVADRIIAIAAGPGPPVAPALIRKVGCTIVAAAVAAVVIEAGHARRSAAGRRRTAATCVELLAGGLLSVAAHPLLSVGVHFICWHAWREMRPLLQVLAPSSLAPDGRPVGLTSLVRGLAVIHRAALPLLLPTWAVLAAVWWFRCPHHAIEDLAIVSLAGYIVVTPAHEALLMLIGPEIRRRMQPSGRGL